MFRPAIRSRDDYDRATTVVRAVIQEWDPYSLIVNCGCPADEWDAEIASIIAQIPHIESELDASNVISRVFSVAFQPEEFDPSECLNVGRMLYSALKASGFI